MNGKSPAFWEAFSSRTDLQRFGVDALLLFALQLKFNIQDISTVASMALTEGGGDKNADLVHIDTESEYAVIAQTYMATKTTNKKGEPKKGAPSKKASDLNSAMSWLINVPIDDLPEEIRPHAEELRLAIKDGAITDIYIWYVHNLPESENVKKELAVVEQTTKSIISSVFPDRQDIEIRALEVGSSTLEEWYESISNPILVSGEFAIPISGGFEISGPDWRSYTTSIPAKWLYEAFHSYKTDLFSADVREYLGSRKADTNINYGIIRTAGSDPSHLWVYNNGITALVHEFEPTTVAGKPSIRFKGFSIVNGAQTTGAIGALDRPPDDNAYVQVRFITCSNPERVRDIVLYNNSQNKVTGPDFRSNDPIQRRLSREFQEVPDIEYVPRRGGYEDIIRRRPNSLPSVTAGQALAAFHGDPEIAYHQKTNMWDDDRLYRKYFDEETTAKHIVFAYSLLLAVENKKLDLLKKSKSNNLTATEETEFNFFRKRGSIFLMVSAIAACMEIFLDKPIPNPFKLTFKGNPSSEEASESWSAIVESTSPFANELNEGISDGFRNRDVVEKVTRTFRSLVAATRQANAGIYSKFMEQVT